MVAMYQVEIQIAQVSQIEYLLLKKVSIVFLFILHEIGNAGTTTRE